MIEGTPRPHKKKCSSFLCCCSVCPAVPFLYRLHPKILMVSRVETRSLVVGTEFFSNLSSCLKFMDPHLRKDIRLGHIDALEQVDADLLSQRTATLNTTLHLAVQYEREECVGVILRKCPSQLWIQNMKGDTALHIAARLGSSSITELLLFYDKEAIGDRDVMLENGGPVERSMTLVRILNKEKDTALHEAAKNGRTKHEGARKGSAEVGRMLIEADKDYEYLANAAGETPLYLASEDVYGSSSMVAQILQTWPSAAHDGPNGMTALHAAAMSHNEDVMKILLEKKSDLVRQADKTGWSALHYAVERPAYVICDALLKFDSSLAIRQDEDGMTPLHVAVSRGSTNALDLLIELCPDCQEVLDNNGRNFLHLAVMRGEKRMVKHTFEKGLITKVIINQPDNDGNTPVHLGALYKNYETIIYLVNNVKDTVNFMAINKENLTAFGIFDKVEILDDDGVDQKYAYGGVILAIASRWYHGRLKLSRESDTSSQSEEEVRRIYWKKRKEKITQQIRNVSDSHLVVATLITTVTFAAGFALPGGYKSDGKDEGMATLLRQTCFQAFAISNTVAMILSSFAVVIHFVMRLIQNKSLTGDLFVWAFLCTFAAIIAMMVAFVTGSYSVLAHSPGIAIPACIIGCSFFLFCGGLLLGKPYDEIKILILRSSSKL